VNQHVFGNLNTIWLHRSIRYSRTNTVNPILIEQSNSLIMCPLLTGLQLMPHICGTKKGSFFKGAYSNQKLAQKTSIETQYKLFQRHVSFYILKISEGCFVWDVPALLISPLLNNIALHILVAVGNRIRLMLKLVNASIIIFIYLKYMKLYRNNCNSIQWTRCYVGLL
jgi:hypothetical protein